jgi:hypothetical protein
MKKPKQTIISVSRRTDIPAYYADWFRKRLEMGYTFYPNPMSGQPVFANLSPENVRAFVFWTRNPKPLFKHLDYIDERYQKRHYMHFTINGLPEILEKRNPKIDFASDCARYLCDRYGSGYVQWRFDPIILSSVTPVSYFVEKFDEISGKIAGLTERCYFSFVDLYDKTIRNIKKIEKETGIQFFDSNLEEQINITKKFQQIADKRNITLHACAEDQLLTITGIEKAHCVDQDLINKVSNGVNKKFKPAPSRLGCGCIESRDIGYYNSCPHGCIYCYANMDPETALMKAKEYSEEGFPYDKLEPFINDQLTMINKQ